MAISFARAGAAGIGIGARSSLTELEGPIASAAKAAGKPAPQVVAATMDVTNKDSMAAAAKVIGKAFPRVDVLINNAGHYMERAWRGDPDTWWYSWEVNLKGVYLATWAFLPLILGKIPLANGDHREPSKLKVIITITSIGANQILSNASAYQTSKLATLRFTESLDADHGLATEDNVLTFAMHPGAVRTEMTKRLPDAWQPALEDTPRLSADTAVFLSVTRQDWLAGRYISAPWDMEELFSKKDETIQGTKLKVRMLV